MATEMATSFLGVWFWLNTEFVAYIFVWNQATMMRFRCVRYCTLTEVRDYWRNKVDADTQ